MKKGKKRKRINREWIVLISIILLIFPVILLTTGTITSGWHLVDDHETVALVKEKLGYDVPFWSAFVRVCHIDIAQRWRPAYWFFRVLAAYVFGENYILHNLFLCLIGMATYALLYGTVRNFKCSPISAHLFAGMVILGRQYEIWYRVANQENIGLFFLAVCLWIVSYQYKNNDFTQKKQDILILICAVFCSLIKESFFLVFPAIILFRLGIEGLALQGGIKSWVKLFVRKIPFWLPALAAFAWSAYMIVFYVGTAPIDYAGVELDKGWENTLWNIMRMRGESLEDFVWITLLCTAVLLIALLFFVIKHRKVEKWYVLLGCMGVYIVCTQIVLYAKSGMWDRYLVPFIVGYGLIFVVFAEKVLSNTGRYLVTAYRALLFLFLAARAYLAVVCGAYPYAEEGRQLQAAMQYMLQETSQETNVLACLGSRETNVAVCMYLSYDNRDNVHFCEENVVRSWSESGDTIIENMDEVSWGAFILTPEESDTAEKLGIETEDWTYRQFGDEYIVWVRGK